VALWLPQRRTKEDLRPRRGRSMIRWGTTAAIDGASTWLALEGNGDEPSTWIVKGLVIALQLVRALYATKP